MLQGVYYITRLLEISLRPFTVTYGLIFSLAVFWLLSAEKESGWYRTFGGRTQCAAAC